MDSLKVEFYVLHATRIVYVLMNRHNHIVGGAGGSRIFFNNEEEAIGGVKTANSLNSPDEYHYKRIELTRSYNIVGSTAEFVSTNIRDKLSEMLDRDVLSLNCYGEVDHNTDPTKSTTTGDES